MKSAEAKTATAAQPAHAQEQAHQPFFRKDGQGSFFSEETKQGEAFFSPNTVQPKLRIGKPNDAYEQEADAMAEKVVGQLSESKSQPAGDAAAGSNAGAGNPGGHSPSTIQTQTAAGTEGQEMKEKAGEEEGLEAETGIQRKAIFESNEDPPDADVQTKLSGAPVVQAKCDKCEQEEEVQKKEEEGTEEGQDLQLQPIFEGNAEPPEDNNTSLSAEPGADIQRMCADCAEEENVGAKEEPEIQTQADATAPAPAATPDLQSRLNNTKGGGKPLPEDTRSSMESGFGADFSGVRVHNDSDAAQMNKDLGAHAFTHGSDIYFNEGKYDPGSTDGQKLLAHELTHTVQQGGAKNRVQRQPEDYIHPEDGQQSKEGINEEIKDELGEDKDINHPVLTAEERSQERPPEDEKGEGVDRTAVQENARPDVDRKEETKPLIDEEIKGFQEEVREQPEQEEPEEQEITTEERTISPKEGAALAAVEAFQKAEAPPVEIEVQPVETPEIKIPKDAAGVELPADPQAQGMIQRIAGKIQMLRERGSQLKQNADIERLEAERMRGHIHVMYHGVYTSDEFIAEAKEHTTARQEGLEQMKDHLAISEERTNQVLENTPGILEQANEGKAESEPMVQSSVERSQENESSGGQDPDAREEAENRGSDLNETTEKSTGIDDAITQAKSKAESMLEEAAATQQQNEEVQGEIELNELKLNQTQEKLGQSEILNTEAKSQLAAQERAPDEHIQQANALDQEADEVIQNSVSREAALRQAQEDYLNNMSTVPGQEDDALGGMIQRQPQTGEAGPIAAVGDSATTQRSQQEQTAHNNQYRNALAEMDAELDAEFENMNFLERGWHGLKFAGLSIMAQLSEVNWSEFTQELIETLVNPVKLLTVMGQMFEMSLHPRHRPGEDPLTYILREAAGLATAIAIIFGTLAGLSLIGMGALLVLNFWFPPTMLWSPPIYTELGLLLSWSGGMLWSTSVIALKLHGLVFLSDLIATAFSSSANALRQNSRQLVTDVEAAAFPIITAVTVGVIKFLGYIGRRLGIGRGGRGGATEETVVEEETVTEENPVEEETVTEENPVEEEAVTEENPTGEEAVPEEIPTDENPTQEPRPEENPQQPVAGGFIRVLLSKIRFSQSWVSRAMDVGGRRVSIEDVAVEMRENGWDYSVDQPDMVDWGDGEFHTLDHRRIVAANQSGNISEIGANIHTPNEPLPSSQIGRFVLEEAFTDPVTGQSFQEGAIANTWGEAAMFRSANQGGGFPIRGSHNLPTIGRPKN